MNQIAESVHPSVDQLRTFGLGQLDEAEASAIEQHVSRCEACCRTVADVRSDTFIDVLRSSSQAAPGSQASEDLTLAPDLLFPPADAGARAPIRLRSACRPNCPPIRATAYWPCSAPAAWGPSTRPSIASWSGSSPSR